MSDRKLKSSLCDVVYGENGYMRSGVLNTAVTICGDAYGRGCRVYFDTNNNKIHVVDNTYTEHVYSI